MLFISFYSANGAEREIITDTVFYIDGSLFNLIKNRVWTLLRFTGEQLSSPIEKQAFLDVCAGEKTSPVARLKA